MLKLGIIGTGQISHEFIKAAKLSGHYELQAVYSRSLASAQAPYQEHIGLQTAHHREQHEAQQRSNNLRHTDGAVEQAQISAHMLARQGVGYNRQRISDDARPGDAD